MKLTRTGSLKLKEAKNLLELAKQTSKTLIKYGKAVWTDEDYKYEAYFEDDYSHRNSELYTAAVYYNTLTPVEAQLLVEESYNKTWLKEFGMEYPIYDYDERDLQERAQDFAI